MRSQKMNETGVECMTDGVVRVKKINVNVLLHTFFI